MNISHIKKLIISSIFIISASLVIAQQSDSIAKVKKADKWVKGRSWARGLRIKLDKSVNSVEFEKQYDSNKARWDKVFHFLTDSKLSTLGPGRYPIDNDNAYATITLGPPKNLEDAKWESHRKYIDLQYVIAGKIKLGVCHLSAAQVIEPYNDKKDAAHYTADGRYYVATPQNFFLFFPCLTTSFQQIF